MKRSSRWFKRSAILALFSLFMASFAPFAAAADKVYFYHNDPLGTPMSVTDGNTGAVVWQADYKPFGEEQSTGDPKVNDRTFIGKEKDSESGLHYFGARYHSSEIGRFISPDPVGAVDAFSSTTNTALLGNPQRLNYYSYGLNNPYKYVDKDGEFAILAVALATLGAFIYGNLMTPGVANTSMDSSDVHEGPSNLEVASKTFTGATIGAAGAIGGGRAAGEEIVEEIVGVNIGLSKRNIKHISRHLSEFKSLDPSMTIDDVINLGRKIASDKKNFVRVKGGNSEFDQVVRIGNKNIKVRAVLNNENGLRSVHIRYE